MNLNLDARATRILSVLAVSAAGFAAGACGDDSSTPPGGVSGQVPTSGAP